MKIQAEQLRQFLYCPRKVYWRDMARIPQRQTFHMEQGSLFHSSLAERNHQFASGINTFRELHMESEALNLKGTADLVVEHENHLMVAEYKHSLPDPPPKGYAIQLAALGMLAEEHLSKPCTSLVFITQNGARISVDLISELRKKVIETIRQVSEMMERGTLPDPTPHRARCRPCEYDRICM